MADHHNTTLGVTWLPTITLHWSSHGCPLQNYTGAHMLPTVKLYYYILYNYTKGNMTAHYNTTVEVTWLPTVTLHWGSHGYPL